jgi:DNA replication and repair protein RecF
LSHGKSYRTRSDRELIQFQQPFATIKVMAQSKLTGDPLVLESQLVLTEQNTLKSVFKLNGNPVRSRSEVVGKIPTVTFFLSDLQMLRGAPEDRRNALDSFLVQYEPVHFKRIAAYNRVRQQKSGLLKQSRQMQIDMNVLESLNQQLAETGAALIEARMQYLQLAEPLAEIRYHELAQGREHLTLRYQASFAMDPETVPVQEIIKTKLYEAICQSQPDELRRGQVLIGPHRDDVRFYLDGHDACQFASQGQQRSIVLAMKLAEIQILQQRLGEESPILLLDDVMAELDPKRQSQLLAHLDPGMQVFLTTTHLDAELQAFLSAARHQGTTSRLFKVSAGTVSQMEGAFDAAFQ